jgi:peptidoglycan/xylan/chitin deacetylase (PgdA/CDA1 family)
MRRGARRFMTALSGRNRLLHSLLVTAILLGCGGVSGAGVGGAAYADDVPLGEATETEPSVRAFSFDHQPLVTICFDDASQTVYDTAFPILSGEGIPASFYFITNYLDDSWAAQLKELENHGWEIGSHSKTHPDLTTLNKADLIEEVRQSKASLEAAGVTVTGFAYPYGIGAADRDVLGEVEREYSYARSVTAGENVPIIRQYALFAQTVYSSTNIATMKGWVDTAIKDKKWLIILMHYIDDTGDTYSTPPADLLELAQYIRGKVDAGEVGAVTVREGTDRYSQTGWQEIEAPQPSMQSDLIVTNGRVLWHFSDTMVDYLYDGYQWSRSGVLRYYESNGQYHTMAIPSHIALESIGPDRAVAAFTMSSSDGAASVLGDITLARGRPLAEVRTSGVQGTPQRLMLAKEMARRFTVDEGSLVTDGWFEAKFRTYGANSQSMLALDTTTDLVRILSHMQRKADSEYASYSWGEFRNGIISVSELPYICWLGGIPFITSSLLAEAENGIPEGDAVPYVGTDASPGTGNTGFTLDKGEAVTVHVAPPAPGRYTLSIRHKGATSADQFGYQIDGGQVVTRAVKGVTFGYEIVPLLNLSAQDHTVRVSAISGTVNLDYVFLTPMSRSVDTPPEVEFPNDVTREARNPILLPAVIHGIR